MHRQWGHWLVCAAGLTISAAGCGGNNSGRPDAAAPDARTDTAITIKTFPNALPTYDGHTANAGLVAFQDGDGAWVALTGTGGVYHATATGTRYGVAVGCANDFSRGLQLYYQSVSDTTEVLADGCFELATMQTLRIELQGLPDGQRTEAWLGNSVGFADSAVVEISHVGSPADLFVRTFVAGTTRVLSKFVRGGTIDLQANQTLQVDLDTQGLAPESHPLTVTGLSPTGTTAETSRVHSSYATPHSELQWPLDTKDFDTAAPDSYVTIDATLRKPDDVSNVTVTALGTAADGRSYERYVRLAMKTPGPITAALPPIWTATAPALDRTGVPRATVTLPMSAATLGISDYHATFSTPVDLALTRTLAIHVRPGWAAGAASVTIATPDLSRLSGWAADMALATDQPVDWRLEWDDRNRAYEALPLDGRKILGTVITGQIALP